MIYPEATRWVLRAPRHPVPVRGSEKELLFAHQTLRGVVMRNFRKLLFAFALALPVWSAEPIPSVYLVQDMSQGFVKLQRLNLLTKQIHDLEGAIDTMFNPIAVNDKGRLLRINNIDGPFLEMYEYAESFVATTPTLHLSETLNQAHVSDVIVEESAVYVLDDLGPSNHFNILFDNADAFLGTTSLAVSSSSVNGGSAFVKSGDKFYVLSANGNGAKLIVEAPNTYNPTLTTRVNFGAGTVIDAKGLAFDASKNLLYTWDANTQYIQKIDVGQGWVVTPTSLKPTGMNKMAIGPDGFLYWVNASGFFRSKDMQSIENIGPAHPYLYFAFDFTNSLDTLATHTTTLKVPKGSGVMWKPSFNVAPTDNMVCSSEIISGQGGIALTNMDRRCQFVATALGGDAIVPSAQARVYISDRRGGLDTMTLNLNPFVNTSPTINPQPSTSLSVPLFEETKVGYKLSDADGDSVSLKIFEQGLTYLGFANFIDPNKGCGTGSETYIAQSYTTGTQTGNLISIEISMGYTGNAFLKIYRSTGPDVNWDDSLLHIQYIPYLDENPNQLRTYLLNKPVTLAANVNYWIVLEQLDGAASYQCKAPDFQSNGAFEPSSNLTSNDDVYMNLYFAKDLPMGMSVDQVSRDSAVFSMVPGSNLASATKGWYYLWSDGFESKSTQASTSFYRPSVLPEFLGGQSEVTVPLQHEAYLEYVVPNWLQENATAPRIYNVQGAGGTSNLVNGAMIDQFGGLSLHLAANVTGVAAMQVQRCYKVDETATQTDCSGWVDFNVRISTPASLDLSGAPSKIEVGVTSKVQIPVSDVDPGQLGQVTITAHREATLKSLDSPLGAQVGSLTLAQEFQNTQGQWITGIQVKGKFKEENVRLLFYKLMGQAYLQSGGDLQFDQALTVKAGVDQWHTLTFDTPLYMNPSTWYAWKIVGGSATTDSLFLNIVSPKDPYSGTYYYEALDDVGNGPEILLKMGSSQYAFAYRLLGPGAAATWAQSTFTGTSPAEVAVTPSKVQEGAQRLLLRTFDGYSEAYKVWAFDVAASVDLGYAIGKNPMVPSSSESKYYNLTAWIDPQTIPTMGNWEVEALSAADATFFANSIPTISSVGDLSFQVAAGKFGSGRFRVRMLVGDQMGIWDTVTVTAKRAPAFAAKLPSLVRAGQDTVGNLGLSDPDAGDLASMQVDVSRLKSVLKQSNTPELRKGYHMNQSFVLADSTTLAEIRIYGQFNSSPIQFTLYNQSLSSKGGNGALFDGSIDVPVNKLAWHRILISKPVQIPKADTIMLMAIMTSNGDSMPEGSWGVSSLNPYKGGRLSLMGQGTSMPSDSLDLAFEIYGRTTKPSFLSLVRNAQNAVTGLRYRPMLADTGSYEIVVSAFDGATSVGFTNLFKVGPPSATDTSNTDTTATDSTTLRLLASTEGQAIRLLLRKGTFADLPKGGKLKVFLFGKDFESSADITTEENAWMISSVDSCRLDWYVKRADGTVLTFGDTTLTGLLQSKKSGIVDRWQMLGFGPERYSFAPLPASTLVYRWDEEESGISGQYRNRSGLDSSEVAAGYWHLSMDSTLPRLAKLSTKPTDLPVKLYHAGSGWNMIANPWSWSIALDSTHDFWTFDPRIGGYRPVYVLGPNMAAWVNVSEETEMTLHAKPVAPFNASLARTLSTAVVYQTDWSMQVRLVSGNLADSWNILGVSRNAQQSPEPPIAMGEQIALAFVDSGRLLARQLRTPQEGTSWTVELQSSRVRNAELQFSDVQALHQLGLIVMVDAGNGTIQQVPTNGVLPITLAKGKTQATFHVVPATQNLASLNGLGNLHTRNLGSSLQIEFAASLALAGKSAKVELIGLDGRVHARTTLSALQSGVNKMVLELPQGSSGVKFLQVRSGKNQVRKSVAIP